MANFSAGDIAFIREQIRILVDPLIMRLRTELYGGDIYGTITVNRLPEAAKLGADDIVQQIENNGDIVPAYTTFVAGVGGVQSGKLLAYQDNRVVHADITNINHAGNIVGVAKEPASEGSDAKVQQYGVYTNSNFNFSSIGPLLPGVNGNITLSLDNSALFSQFVGIALASDKMFIAITPSMTMI